MPRFFFDIEIEDDFDGFRAKRTIAKHFPTWEEALVFAETAAECIDDEDVVGVKAPTMILTNGDDWDIEFAKQYGGGRGVEIKVRPVDGKVWVGGDVWTVPVYRHEQPYFTERLGIALETRHNEVLIGAEDGSREWTKWDEVFAVKAGEKPNMHMLKGEFRA